MNTSILPCFLTMDVMLRAPSCSGHHTFPAMMESTSGTIGHSKLSIVYLGFITRKVTNTDRFLLCCLSWVHTSDFSVSATRVLGLPMYSTTFSFYPYYKSLIYIYIYIHVYVKLSTSYSDIQTSTQLLIITGILNISAMKY